MASLNRIIWDRDRIIAYKKYLAGNKSIEYRGRKRNGEPYKKALMVDKLINRQPSVNLFSPEREAVRQGR